MASDRPLIEPAPVDPMVPLPQKGRVFERTRRVRLGDANPAGRLRLDAYARYLQDVSNDDTRDAGFDDEMGWVVRKTVVEVTRFASFGEVVTLRTFCGGTGGRWAERRVSLTGDAGAAMEASTLWVHLDTVTQRPKPLPAQFFELFGEAAGGRTVRARLHHPEPPAGSTGEPWPLRCSDVDVLGHMNNAAYWEIVEDHLARRRDLRAPLRAELEFRAAVEPDHHIAVVDLDGPDELSLWVVAEPGVCASAVVRRWA